MSFAMKLTWRALARQIAMLFQQEAGKDCGEEQAYREAKDFIQRACDIQPLQWIEQCHQPCDAISCLRHLLNARFFQHQPLSNALGKQFFWKHDFYLNRWTLDPRTESEGIISLVKQKKVQCHRILDLGTGTGCLLSSLLYEYKEAIGVGVDIEPRALYAADFNGRQIGTDGRSTWMESHWFSNVEGLFDCIVSNPPYIKMHDILPLNVNLWDPPMALRGGLTGLLAYESLIPLLPAHLAPEGLVVLEIGWDQAADICDIFRHKTPFYTQVVPDLFGKDRYIMASPVPFQEKYRP